MHLICASATCGPPPCKMQKLKRMGVKQSSPIITQLASDREPDSNLKPALLTTMWYMLPKVPIHGFNFCYKVESKVILQEQGKTSESEN